MLWRTVYGVSLLKEIFVKRRDFHPGSGFLSHCYMTGDVESVVKINSFHSLPNGNLILQN